MSESGRISFLMRPVFRTRCIRSSIGEGAGKEPHVGLGGNVGKSLKGNKGASGDEPVTIPIK